MEKRPVAAEDLLRLTKEGAKPAWSPDGEFVAFTGNRLADPDRRPTVADLYVIAVAGSEAKRLTGSDGAAQLLAWSPDGKEIAYL